MYNGPVIDPHHHFWNYGSAKHAWLRPADDTAQALGGLAALRQDFLPDDYVSRMREHNVVGSVHIEALWDTNDPLGETNWLETLERPAGVAARYVAAAPFGTSFGASVIREQHKFERVVGIRAIISNHPDASKSWVSDPNLADSDAWRKDIAVLAGLGLHLELMMYPYQAQSVARLAKDFPDLTIVVNHCGSPIDQDDEGMALWRSALGTLATHENIQLKVSDIAAYVPEWTPDRVTSIIKDCLIAFGTERCMFGTDYPVVTLQMSLEDAFNTFHQAIANLSGDEQRAIMHDNAFRIYRF